MHQVIYAPNAVGRHATALRAAGVTTVIRPCGGLDGSLQTNLSRSEAADIANSEMNLVLLSLSADTGLVLHMAEGLGMAPASAVYFNATALVATEGVAAISALFAKLRKDIARRFRIGVFGTAEVCQTLLALELVDHAWLCHATEDVGHMQFLSQQSWSLWQLTPRIWPGLEVPFSPVLTNPAIRDFGQSALKFRSPYLASFTPESVDPVFAVTARNGASLRSGPGPGFGAVQHLNTGSYLFVKDIENGWVRVDLIGDHLVDGYVLCGDLEPILGDVSLDYPPLATAFDIAQAELAADQCTSDHGTLNPRLYNYNATTGAGGRDPVHWAASFVNYCVQRAGYVGTNNKWALRWHETSWGWEVTGAVQPGDIAVWECRDGSKTGAIIGGYVGFIVDVIVEDIMVLGAHSSGRLRISKLPRTGLVRGVFYNLRSIRRAHRQITQTPQH